MQTPHSRRASFGSKGHFVTLLLSPQLLRYPSMD